MPVTQPITHDQKASLDFILAGDVALVSSAFDGQPCALIAAVEEQADGSYDVTPLAILITGTDLFGRLTDPSTDLPSE